MEEGETGLLLQSNKELLSSGYSIHEYSEEIKKIKSALTWVFLDQSNLWRAGLSWSLFFILTIGVPLVSHFMFACLTCDTMHQRPFDALVQVSLSLFATLSFVSLSSFARKYGIRKFLFLDKLYEDSEKVQQGYTEQLHRSMKILSSFVLPSFIAESIYKIWWFSSGGTQIPYLYNAALSNIFILRLEEFAQVFEKQSDVSSIMIEHLRIRRNLRVISHRFRVFILSTLILVTISQFLALLLITEPSSTVNIFTAGELALSSITLVTGLFMCLRSAAKITHKAQAVTSLAAKWHACATISTLDDMTEETPMARTVTSQVVYPINSSWDTDEEGDGDDVLDNTNMVPIHASTISYQKRQALVTYFEHNKAGITVYGFMLDRTWLHTIFAIQLSLTLWILNKTIGIS
uniref:Extracellular ligand-gated ion channel n=1 Tax=Solanum tuberosum TaxID=4113 RepID=M1B0T4_SOLTU